MKMRVLLVAAGLLAASAAPVLADSVTAKVLNWDPSGRTITLQDNSQFMDIAPAVAVPADLTTGDRVTVSYADKPEMDGVQTVTAVVIVTPSTLLSANTPGN